MRPARLQSAAGHARSSCPLYEAGRATLLAAGRGRKVARGRDSLRKSFSPATHYPRRGMTQSSISAGVTAEDARTRTRTSSPGRSWSCPWCLAPPSPKPRRWPRASARRGAPRASTDMLGEAAVADNGSTDGSREIAAAEGARVVAIEERGYGSARWAGSPPPAVGTSSMGHADDSYHFLELPSSWTPAALATISRRAAGWNAAAGAAASGRHALPPPCTGVPDVLGDGPHLVPGVDDDVDRGLRGFTEEARREPRPALHWKEFATETIIKSSLGLGPHRGGPDHAAPGWAPAHTPRTSGFRNGWRTRASSSCSAPLAVHRARFRPRPDRPARLRGGPAAVHLFGRHLRCAHAALRQPRRSAAADQSIMFGRVHQVFAVSEGLHPTDPRLERLSTAVKPRAGDLLLVGSRGGRNRRCSCSPRTVADRGVWRISYASTMRLVVPGVTVTALGFQTLLSSSFVSVLALRRI